MIRILKPESDEWDSGLNIITEPIITVEQNLLQVCNQIQQEFPRLEFSILAKGKYNSEGFYVTDEYVIPKQKVGSASVDYEDLYLYQKEGFNVVIHSHHNIGTFFSKTDIDHINSHFPCSILYTIDGFTLATLSFHTGNSTFLMKTNDIEIEYSNSILISGIENIKRKYDYTYTPANNLKNATKLRDKEDLEDDYDEVEIIGDKQIDAICMDCNYYQTKYCFKCVETYADDELEWEERIKQQLDNLEEPAK